MILKSFVFAFISLLILGCGVMNNPNSKGEVSNGALTNEGVPKGNQLVMVSKIDIPILDASINFTSNNLTTYRLFETNASTAEFFTDLNNFKEWEKSINDANISYQTSNLLYYPVYQEMSCGLIETIKVDDKNATITLKATADCNATSIYHILWYKISKNLENITVHAFNAEPFSFQNRAN